MMIMTCVKCGAPLKEVPFYNNSQDNDFAPSMPFCTNSKCSRNGLLTAVFKNRYVDDKHTGVQQEDVSLPEPAPDPSV